MAITAEQWQARAIRESGGKPTNAAYRFELIYGTIGGSFTVEVNGLVTQPIAFPASADAVKVALEALPTVGIGGLKVSGALGGPYKLEFIGDNAGQDVAAPVIDGSLLQPLQDVEVELVSRGQTNDYTETAATAWTHNSKAQSDTIRFLKTKIAIYDQRLNDAVEAVDTRTGQVNEVDIKLSQITMNLERRKSDIEGEIANEIYALSQGARRTHGGQMTTTTTNDLPYGTLTIDQRTGNLR